MEAAGFKLRQVASRGKGAKEIGLRRPLILRTSIISNILAFLESLDSLASFDSLDSQF